MTMWNNPFHSSVAEKQKESTIIQMTGDKKRTNIWELLKERNDLISAMVLH